MNPLPFSLIGPRYYMKKSRSPLYNEGQKFEINLFHIANQFGVNKLISTPRVSSPLFDSSETFILINKIKTWLKHLKIRSCSNIAENGNVPWKLIPLFNTYSPSQYQTCYRIIRWKNFICAILTCSPADVWKTCNSTLPVQKNMKPKLEMLLW